MKKKSYYLAPTTLNEFLNEQKSVTLTRKYGQKDPVVVGTRAPLRNQVLSFVAENQQVSRIKLKKFIAGLNEGSKNPNAAANMWLKRNNKFFITEERNGISVYKLSKLGHKLLERMSSLAESKMNEKDEKDHDFKVNGKKGIHDEKDEKVDESEDKEVDEKCDEEVSESKKERIQKLVEQIRAKRAKRLYEEEEEELEGPDEEEEDEVEVEDEESDDEVEDDEGEEEEVEDDDKVEVTEFIISVDDVAEAIAELGELGIEAEEVAGEVGDDMDMDMDMDLESPEEGGEEVDDFDLDLGGDIEGEEEEMEGEEEMEESVTGMEKFSKSRNAKYGDSPANLTEEEDDDLEEMQVTGFGDKNKKSFKKSDPGLLEDDDELGMDDLDLEGPEGGEESEEVDMDIEGPEGEEDTEFDMGEAPEGGSQIRVSAEQWPALKKWLEEKGVDIEEMFGGEIEMEGEDVEDEISFDGLEDTGEEKGGEEVEDDEEEVDVEVEDDEEDDEEVEEGYKK